MRRKEWELKEKQRQNYDGRHRASDQAVLEPGDEVWITDKNESGEVGEDLGHRSYIVHTPTGMLRRNRQHLNHIPSGNEQGSSMSRKETAHSTPMSIEQSTDFPGPSETPTHPMTPRRSSRVRKAPDQLGVW